MRCITTGETTRTSECARRVTPTPEVYPDQSTTSTRDIEKPWQGVFLLPPFGLIEGMGACSQNHGCQATPTLASCQEQARRSIPLPSKHVNGSDSSCKAAGAPWGAPLQPPSPHFELHKHAFQQSGMAKNSMFCGVKNRYMDRTTSRSQGIKQ